MTIQEKVKSEMIIAMKAGYRMRKDNLKYLMGMFQNKSTNVDKTVDDVQAIALIKSMAKGIKEAQKMIKDFDSEEFKKNQDFLYMCDSLLPKQASEEEIIEFIKTTDYMSAGPAFIGTVIKHFNGQADGSLVKKVLNELKG